MASSDLPDHAADPWRDAARLHLRIFIGALPGDLVGYWHAEGRTIMLDDRLDAAEKDSALAHQLTHVEREDAAACSACYWGALRGQHLPQSVPFHA